MTSMYIVNCKQIFTICEEGIPFHSLSVNFLRISIPITKYCEFCCSSMPMQCLNWKTLLQAEHLGLVSHMSLTSQESRDTLDQDQELATVAQTNKQVEETTVLPTQVSIIQNPSCYSDNCFYM